MNGKFSYKDQNLDRPACKLVYICCIFGKFEMDNDWLLMPLEELQFLAQLGRDGFIFQPLWLPLGLFCVKKEKKEKEIQILPCLLNMQSVKQWKMHMLDCKSEATCRIKIVSLQKIF